MHTNTAATMFSDKGSRPALASNKPIVASSTAAAVPTIDEPILAAEVAGDYGDEDVDSALGDNNSLSTASVSSSILQYRTMHGRTFHSDKYQNYFTPNDRQQQESIDLTHHYLTLLLDGAVFLAPVANTVKNVLDIGTGTGIWAIDVSDQFPDAQIIGTDISPIQSTWVPPNTRFEIDDATQPWSWGANAFDFIHIRYLVGAIANWDTLFSEAYRCCEPGGWLESCELCPKHQSDDGTDKMAPVFEQFWKLYTEGMPKLGRSFNVVKDGTQRAAMEKAGFKNITDKSYKLPVGTWPADKKMLEIGQYVLLTLVNDLEGYTTFLWNEVLGYGENEYQVFLMQVRKAVRDKRIHTYYSVRYVYGQKPYE